MVVCADDLLGRSRALKKASGCRGYLIIRDIFPECMVDMGLMGRGLPYRFFGCGSALPVFEWRM